MYRMRTFSNFGPALLGIRNSKGSDAPPPGCPSQAQSYLYGPIASESFTLVGNSSPPPQCVQPNGNLQVLYNFNQQQAGTSGQDGVVIDRSSAGIFTEHSPTEASTVLALCFKLTHSVDWVFNPLFSFCRRKYRRPARRVDRRPERQSLWRSPGRHPRTAVRTVACTVGLSSISHRGRRPVPPLSAVGRKACLIASLVRVDEAQGRFMSPRSTNKATCTARLRPAEPWVEVPYLNSHRQKRAGPKLPCSASTPEMSTVVQQRYWWAQMATCTEFRTA